MAKAGVVTIEHLEVKKKDIEKVKKIFGVKDDTEAVKKAVDMALGKIELEGIFEKHKGVRLKKVCA